MKHCQEKIRGSDKTMIIVFLFICVVIPMQIGRPARSTELPQPSKDRSIFSDLSGITANKKVPTVTHGLLPALTYQPECPLNTIFGQPSHGPDDGWYARTSDKSLGWLAYENFSGVEENICKIYWWGLMLRWTGAWNLCEKDVDYLITFYGDIAGQPGDAVASRVVHPSHTFVEWYDSNALWYFEAAIYPIVDLSEGWISIQGILDQSDLNCAFLWMSSGIGDGKSYQLYGSDLILNEHDLAFCLVMDNDGDDVADIIDNCPDIFNPNQENSDQDNAGDICDPCPNDPNDDVDQDDLCADVDNCPAAFNPEQDDVDQDGAGDICDNCLSDFNPNQEDDDKDGQGNACDPCPYDSDDDADQDGLCADMDNCPCIENPGQEDSNGDGLGDVCQSLRGDVDCNLTVNILDVLRVVNIILEVHIPTGYERAAGDCNGDGTVNIVDALGIVNKVLAIGECAP